MNPKQHAPSMTPHDVANKKSHDSTLRKTNPTKSLTPNTRGVTTSRNQVTGSGK